jgi:hypothetical protein
MWRLLYQTPGALLITLTRMAVFAGSVYSCSKACAKKLAQQRPEKFLIYRVISLR